MRLVPPFPLSTIDNPFGVSPINYQAVSGTKGHPGIDFNVPYGTPIHAATDAYCSVVLSKDNPNLMAFRAVNTLVEDSTGCYEVQYGHCSSIMASVGQKIAQGEVIGAIGNTGDVFVGGREITAKEKNAGSTAGSHLHFQVRVVKKVPVSQQLPGRHYLNDGFGDLIINGYAYEVPNFENGYNGCVDPMQFFSLGFTRNLFMGMRNADVARLQGIVGAPQTGFFGPLTLGKVIQYQRGHNLAPTGFVGPQTRAVLNEGDTSP